MSIIQDAIDLLHSYDFQETDILWVGNEKKQCSWEQFKILVADKILHDELENVSIFGKNFILSLPDYDCCEQWELRIIPLRPLEELTFDDIIGYYYKNRIKYDAQRAKINARNREKRLAKKVENKK